MKIGWVGFGSIGTQMALKALAAGHELTAYARGQGLETVRAAGAKPCADYRELAAGSEILGICLFSDAQLREVLFDKGALAAMRPGSVVCIHTTGSPDLAREIGAAAPAGVSILDATFSGGPHNVQAGDLVLMVGGEADPLERAKPLLTTYASNINHVGPLGHGQMLKLLNNLLFATNLMNAIELLKIAQSQGFDTRTVANIIQASSGGSYSLRSFQSDRTLSEIQKMIWPYLEKDVSVVATVAAEMGVDMSTFAPVIDYYRKA